MNTKGLAILSLLAVAVSAHAITFTAGLPGSNPKTAFGFGNSDFTASAGGATYTTNLAPQPSLASGVGEFKWNFYAEATTPGQYLTSIDFAITVETTGPGSKWKPSAISYYVGPGGEYIGAKETADTYNTISGPGEITLHQTLNLAPMQYNKWHFFLDDFFRTTDGVVIKGVGATVTENPPVPEPASMAVLGFGALGLLRKRRNSRAS